MKQRNGKTLVRYEGTFEDMVALTDKVKEDHACGQIDENPTTGALKEMVKFAEFVGGRRSGQQTATQPL